MSPRAIRAAAEAGLVIAGFALLAVLITWPAARSPDTILPTQGLPWDPAGFTWDLWQRLRDGLPLFGTGTTSLSPPFTTEYPAAFNLLQLAFYGPAVAIAGITTPLVAMNVMIMAGIALSGAAMYALVRWIGCGPAVSAWSGFALAIAPYVVGKAVVHATLVNVACFPLLILACLWWNERPTWKRAFAVTAAFAFAWTANGYYGLVAVVIVVILCGYGLTRLLRRTGWRRTGIETFALTTMLGVLVVLPIAISVWSSATATPVRDKVNLAQFGARLSDYVIPPKGQFLATGLDATWTGQQGASGEQTILYLGITTIVVAMIGAAIAWWRPGWLIGERSVTAVRIATLLIPILIWFSLAWPSTIAGVPIPVPGRAVWSFAQEFRAFARFGAAVMVVVILVAAVAISALARRGGPLWRYSIVSAAVLATAADLSTGLPVTTTPPANPNNRDPTTWPAWIWLRESPVPGAVMEYPTGPALPVPELELIRRVWSHGQLVHGRPLADGAGPMGQWTDQRALDFARQVADPRLPGAAEELATAGVAFVTINTWAYPPGMAPDAHRPAPGFIAATTVRADTGVWRVTASPEAGVAVFRQPGFGPPVVLGGSRWHAVVASPARLTTWARRRGIYRFQFPLLHSSGGISVRVAGPPPARIAVSATTLDISLRTGPAGRDITILSPSPRTLIGRPSVTRVSGRP